MFRANEGAKRTLFDVLFRSESNGWQIRRQRRTGVSIVGSVELLETRSLLSAVGLQQENPAIAFTPIESNRLLVKFVDQPFTVDGARLVEAFSGFGGVWEVEVQHADDVARAVAAYEDSGRVEFAHPDVGITVAAIPDDTRFAEQWSLNNTGQSGGTNDADIDGVEAWDLERDAGSVVVAVIYSGIDYTHPDLADNIWTNPDEIAGNGIDDDGNGYVDDIHGYDFVNNDGDPMDDFGHGTHVAGIIGAVGDNNQGVAGVAWNVQLMPLKFLDRGGNGTVSSAARAIDYAMREGADIANNSWTGEFTSLLNLAVQRFRDQGGIFIASAGNDQSDNDRSPVYPANLNVENVISVASSGDTDQLSRFSNYGSRTVDFVAPGEGILSTSPGGEYAIMSGTSMAAPHVSGAAALVKARHPDWTYDHVIRRLRETADPVLTSSVVEGRLNLFSALDDGLPPGDRSGARVVSAYWAGSYDGIVDRVRLRFSEPIDVTTFGGSDVDFVGPDGSIGISSIVDVSDNSATEFLVTFPNITDAGSYQFIIGPDVLDLAGNPMNQDSDLLNGEASDTYTLPYEIENAASQTFEWTGELRLRDAGRSNQPRQTLVSLIVEQQRVIEDLTIEVEIAHDSIGELDLLLQAPSGETVPLMTQRGGSGTGILATFDDDAQLAIADGDAPFDGRFKPEQSLSLFDGIGIRGRWKLIVIDHSNQNTGLITAFRLNVETKIGSANGAAAATIWHQSSDNGQLQDIRKAAVVRPIRASIAELGADESLVQQKVTTTVRVASTLVWQQFEERRNLQQADHDRLFVEWRSLGWSLDKNIDISAQ